MIISCGEALIDCFQHQDSASFDAIIGGSPLNVAVALANAGSDAALMTNISTDQFGEMHMAHLHSNNVATQYISRSAHLSGLMFVQYRADKSATYNFYGHDTAELNYQFHDLSDIQSDDLSNDKTAFLTDAITCLHFGSFSLVCGQTATSFAQLIKEQQQQRIICVDINIRTAIEPDLQIWSDKFTQLMQQVHILKASSEDLCLLYDLENFTKQEALRIMTQWHKAGVAIAVITDAENGAYAMIDEQLIHVPALDVDIIDTVGAGDCFMAFFLNQLEQQHLLHINALPATTTEQLHKAVTAGITAAAFTVEHKGAQFPKLSASTQR
ncbi:MAG: PfkB family carbohydrate kinase [Oceanospirillaceae bacterium]